MNLRKGKIPNSIIGEKYLSEKFGREKAGTLIGLVNDYYDQLLLKKMKPENKILRFHLNKYILPGLALYRALLEEYSGDADYAMADVEEVVRLTILKQTRLLFSPLKWVQKPFNLFRWGFKFVMKAFPAQGWTIDYLENSPQSIAFNITHCYYHEVLTRLGTPELTRVFCTADDAMAENFPSCILFERSTTIGKGGEYCDFRYHQAGK